MTKPCIAVVLQGSKSKTLPKGKWLKLSSSPALIHSRITNKFNNLWCPVICSGDYFYVVLFLDIVLRWASLAVPLPLLPFVGVEGNEIGFVVHNLNGGKFSILFQPQCFAVLIKALCRTFTFSTSCDWASRDCIITCYPTHIYSFLTVFLLHLSLIFCYFFTLIRIGVTSVVMVHTILDHEMSK